MEANPLLHINPKILGEQLQQSRKRVGMTQDAAAEQIGLARTTLISIEKGDRVVKPGELIKLARAYGRPITDFVSGRNHVDSFAVQFRGPAFRSPDDDQSIEPDILKFEQLCENYIELERITESPLNRKYPAEYSVVGRDLNQAAENIAMMERHRLNLGDGPVSRLRDILEQDVGIRIFYIELHGSFSEMYVYNDQLGGCLAINSNQQISHSLLLSLTRPFPSLNKIRIRLLICP